MIIKFTILKIKRLKIVGHRIIEIILFEEKLPIALIKLNNLIRIF